MVPSICQSIWIIIISPLSGDWTQTSWTTQLLKISWKVKLNCIYRNNDNEEVTPSILWDALKVVIRGNFIAVATTVTPFASPSSPIHIRTHAPSLLLAHPHLKNLTHTHTSHTALFLKGATPILQQWQLEMQETHRQNLNPLLFHGSRRCGSILDWQWVMLTTFSLSTKKPQFASSAETGWQVILFRFPLDWRYKLLLHYIVNKCFKFDNVVWYILNKGQILDII